MSSVASSARLSAAVTSRTIRQKLIHRSFVTSTPRHAASNYLMPAMSPTMTEGNIATWKVKEGAAYSAGDVLLEIETDKAQMDVEAQDDGILAKIMQGDGTKGIQVGARIAVMAEEGDDLASLEIPPDESPKTQPAEEKKQPEQKESSSEQPQQSASAEVKQQSEPAAGEEPARPSPGKPQTEQRYPLYPSVMHLLHTNNIPLSDASKITATGPAGRLLKGDVLAYLKAIPPNYSAEQSERLEKLSHLDLSNIKRVDPRATTKEPAVKASTSAPAPVEDIPTQIAVPISLAAVLETQARIRTALGLDLPLSTFIARASELANEDLPRARAAPTADELFDSVLGLEQTGRKTSRGSYVPQITALAPPAVGARPLQPRRAPDVLDALTGKTQGARPAARRATSGAAGVADATGRNVFSVAARKGEEARVRTYLERVKTVLEAEPGRLVL